MCRCCAAPRGDGIDHHLQHEVPAVRGLNAAGYVPWTPVWFAGGVDIFFVITVSS